MIEGAADVGSSSKIQLLSFVRMQELVQVLGWSRIRTLLVLLRPGLLLLLFDRHVINFIALEVSLPFPVKLPLQLPPAVIEASISIVGRIDVVLCAIPFVKDVSSDDLALVVATAWSTVSVDFQSSL